MVENFHRPVVLRTCVGSFDYVRLAPHFAQDDRAEIPVNRNSVSGGRLGLDLPL